MTRVTHLMSMTMKCKLEIHIILKKGNMLEERTETTGNMLCGTEKTGNVLHAERTETTGNML